RYFNPVLPGRLPAVMFNGTDSAVLDAASLRQQRRLKQAIQFLHKDSADLLPLDGLKKLGTSTQGPHHILQKRLLEAKLSQGRMNMCRVTPNNGHVFLNLTGDHLIEGLLHKTTSTSNFSVCLQCLGKEVNILIDTGCKLNLMSSLTVERLGLKELVDENKMETEGFPFQRKLCVDGHIRELSLTIGQLRIMCSFAVVGKEEEYDLFKYTWQNETVSSNLLIRDQVQFAKKLFSSER
uniref:Uncharacterized protein n=1 Tax=Echeneis naucrates TaxID=173247 RepID=A0A665WPU2_ECHNA